MKDTPGIHSMYGELAAGMELTKCQQCGCMQETLDALASCLAADDTDEAQSLARDVAAWRKQMQAIRYTCLGCAYCYPAVAQNAFATAFPSLSQLPSLQCDFEVRAAEWPSRSKRRKMYGKRVARSSLPGLYPALLIEGNMRLARETRCIMALRRYNAL